MIFAERTRFLQAKKDKAAMQRDLQRAKTMLNSPTRSRENSLGSVATPRSPPQPTMGEINVIEGEDGVNVAMGNVVI